MKCPACGGTGFREWGRRPPYSILQCAACGLGVTVPAPEEERLGELNRLAYDAERRASDYAAREKEFRARYKKTLARIKNYRSAGALLDVGCGIGTFLNAAREEGFRAAGVELNAGCAAYGREKFGLDIRTGRMEDAAFPPGTFDVVTMFDVLEHAADPHAMLASAASALKPGGLLVLRCPNLDSFMAKLLKENWGWLTPPDHLYHFTLAAIGKLLEGGGFELKEAGTWEPARDFTGNIYSGFPAAGKADRVFRKVLWLSSMALIPLLQRLWWRAGKGALADAYAVKTGQAAGK